MQLIDLNTDVLLRISDHLSGTDALNFSLTAKALHDIAIHRVGVTLRADDHDDLRHYYHSVHCAVPRRTHFLESLSLEEKVFENSNREIVPDSWSADDEDMHQPTGSEAAEFPPPQRSAIKILVDLLFGARNLSTLSLTAVHALMSCNGQVAPALASLPRLTHATLINVSDMVVQFVGETSWKLHTLDIDYNERYRGTVQPEESIRTAPVLLNALAQFSNLHTLKVTGLLYDGDQGQAFSTATPSAAPRFPSIRRLFVCVSQVLFALDLADRCPSAHVIDLSSCTLQDYSELESRPFSSWPALRSLRAEIEAIHMACCSDRVLGLGVADHLQLSDLVRVLDEHEADVRHLLCILSKTSPVYAQLNVTVASEPIRFWPRVAECAPRLRYLELRVALDTLNETSMNWVVRPFTKNSLLPVSLAH